MEKGCFGKEIHVVFERQAAVENDSKVADVLSMVRQKLFGFSEGFGTNVYHIRFITV